MTYRDAAEEFSNRYHFTGEAPVDHTGWHDLAVALWTILAPMFDPTITLVRAYGYLDDGTDSVMTIDFTAVPLAPLPGTGTVSGIRSPGDAAMTSRWKTARVNSKGKPIYLRKYWHGVQQDTTDHDKVAGTQHSAQQTATAALIADWGSTSSQLCGPDGVVPTLPSASIWVTTRTLKRRGRRPPS
jgi:hypothetical protein